MESHIHSSFEARMEWKCNCNAICCHRYLFRILGGSCNNKWIVEETGDDTNDEGDIASCMETEDEEKGKD